jgi:tetratricopeptide (TPR) repeat protein
MKSLLKILLILCLWLCGCSGDPNERANELYVEAVKLISSAEEKTRIEAIKDYEKALDNLQKIVNDYSKSDLAVKLVSDQTLFTGKSMADIKNRIAELKKLEIAAANELYVEAVKLISSAGEKTGIEAVKDYEKALDNLQKIVNDYSKSDLAVKLVSNQALFDGKSMADMKNRVAELRKRVIAENNKAFGAGKIVIIRSIKPTDAQQKEQQTIYGLKNSDAGRIMTTVPGVKRVLPILRQRKNVVHGKREVDCHLIGTFPYYPDFTQSKIVAGKFLNEAEENSKASSCVITLELAERLFAGHNPLMEKVIVRGFESSQVFQVKGILHERSANVYIPLSTFKALYGTRNIDRSTGSLSIEVVELTEIRVEFESVKEVIPALPLLRNCLNKSRKGKADYEIHTPLLQK